MLDLNETRIESLVVHRVGNKLRDEGVIVSQSLHAISDRQETTLLNYFLHSMPGLEMLRFTHSSELRLNEVFTFCRKIFISPGHFLPQTVKILRHLYACSEHPKIRAGEVLFAYFTSIGYLGNSTAAVGIFKTEHKQPFLKITSEDHGLALDIEEGTHLKAPDKGCVILNTDEADGYRVLCVDKEEDDTRYWRDRFLNLAPLQDDAFLTRSVLDICHSLVDTIGDTLPHKDKIIFSNKAVDYFLANEYFNPDDFAREVMESKDLQSQFEQQKTIYEKEHAIAPIGSFPISKPVAKTAKRALKNLIKLDTKMELRLRSRDLDQAAEFLERGFDKQKKMFFYKVYFNKEL